MSSASDQQSSVHESFMRRALELAKLAVSRGNHPFGALLVNQKGEIVLESENTVHSAHSSVRHAELNLMDNLKNAKSPSGEAVDPAQCTMYTSTEPCAMCCGAVYWSGVRRVVFGCPASGDKSLETIAGHSLLISCETVLSQGVAKTTIVGPVLQEEAFNIHKDFGWQLVAGQPCAWPAAWGPKPSQ